MKGTRKHISDRFKPYLTVKDGYKGGKGPKPGQSHEHFYKLSSNENPLGPSPKAIAAIQPHLSTLHIYPDTTDARLREALAAHYDHQLSVNQFLCASSGSELIDHVIRAFVREGDEVIITNPCFVPYRTFSTWSGARVIDVPLLPDTYAVDESSLLAAINDHTRIIFLASPNNPTGTHIPKATLERLLAQIPEDIIVIYDEVYWHFADAADFVRGYHYIAQYPNLIAINSFSKTYGLAALRVGYGYTSEVVANYIRQIVKPFHLTKPSMEGAIAALDDQAFVDETVSLIHTERQFLETALADLNIPYVPTQGNFLLLTPPTTDQIFADHMWAHNIAVRPVKNYGAPGKVRVSIGTHAASEAFLAACHSLLQAHAV